MKRAAVLATFLTGFALSPAGAYSPMPIPDLNHTELHRAAEGCDAAKARAVLEALPAGEKSAALDRLDREGYTPLSYAARAGCMDVVKLLVGQGASVDRAEDGGWTPLLQASNQHHAEVAGYLIDHGANANYETRIGKTPLSEALSDSVFAYGPEGDREATVKTLMQKGASTAALITAFDGLRAFIGDLGRKVEALETHSRSLEEELRRLTEILSEISAQVGNGEPRPS